MDRCAANHTAIQLLNEEWQKPSIELNCHLHPLDSVTTKSREALKKEGGVRGQLFSKDCLTGNTILQMIKLRFKDRKGDPKGFVCFLEEKKLKKASSYGTVTIGCMFY